ncbi:MAG TPA: efflux RND transporter periplasmic adaptor subunit [Vicinamibacterales bacterium]|nr:efflux RND transporter periplasmic adaptor subunit [Vicinamibacterales bacterium]
MPTPHSVPRPRRLVRRAAVASVALGAALLLLAAGCAPKAPQNSVRASGQVDATDVALSPEVGGRVLERHAIEGDRVTAGEVIAKLDTADAELALRRAQADRDQAAAQLQLLEAGSRREDVQQAEAQLAVARAQVPADQAQLTSAQQDVDRFESLLQSNSGSRKQRDDAVTRRDVVTQQLQAARDSVRAAQQVVDRLRAGARPQEIRAAKARLAATDAQMAMIQKNLSDATVISTVSGIVTSKLVEAGELVAPHTPLVIVSDLDHAWANVYVQEPIVPRIRLGQQATVFTDAGGAGLPGTVSFIASQAEFTPRNVQTADDRAMLVYRIKIAVDNRQGVLKEGMPVEAQIPLQPMPAAAPEGR